MPNSLPASYENIEREDFANLATLGKRQQATCIVTSKDERVLVHHKRERGNQALLAVNVQLNGVTNIESDIVTDPFMNKLIKVGRRALSEAADVKFLGAYRFAPKGKPDLLLLPCAVELDVSSDEVTLDPETKREWVQLDWVEQFLNKNQSTAVVNSFDAHHALGLYLKKETILEFI